MTRPSKQRVWQAVAFVACVGVLWIHLDDFGASEFSGGWLTGKIFTMADIGGLVFLPALVLSFFLPRVAAIVGLVATLLCLPFYVYIVMPGPYRRIFWGRIFRPATETIHLEQLGYRRNHHPDSCGRFEHSAFVRPVKLPVSPLGKIRASTYFGDYPVWDLTIYFS